MKPMTMTINSDDAPVTFRCDDEIIEHALYLVERRAREKLVSDNVLKCPDTVVTWLRLRLGAEATESVYAVFLNNANQPIEFRQMFTGTVSECPVYVREVAKAALLCNAAAVVISHNHPSRTEALPSKADRNMTRALGCALDVLQIALLDHVIVTSCDTFSFAKERIIDDR